MHSSSNRSGSLKKRRNPSAFSTAWNGARRSIFDFLGSEEISSPSFHVLGVHVFSGSADEGSVGP
jgi:hypothetical protein